MVSPEAEFSTVLYKSEHQALHGLWSNFPFPKEYTTLDTRIHVIMLISSFWESEIKWHHRPAKVFFCFIS